MDPNTQFWLEVWKLIVTAAVTVTVGVITAWIANNQRKIAASQRDIAHEQRRVATAKLNLDLFDQAMVGHDRFPAVDLSDLLMS
jgi:hypothetical protein